MTFLNPTLALAGLAAVSIPILIHILMRRRRRPVMWGAMRFLLEAYRRQRRRLRLEQLLLLAARCAVVALVALALGRPILGAAGLLSGRGATTVYLLIDNSLTASAVDESGRTGLERAKVLAREAVAGLDAGRGDRVGLIALGGPAEAVVVPASSDLGSVRDLTMDLRATDSAADMAGAARLLRDELARQEPGGRTLVVVLSDFLAGTGGPDKALPPIVEAGAQARVAVLASRPAEEGVGNVAITGVEPLRAVMLAGDGSEQPNQVRVMLRRFGPAVGESAATKVRVRIAREGEAPGAISPQAEQVVRWAPGQSEATAAVPAGASGGAGAGVIVAEIDRDAVAGDNAWRRPVQVREALRIGLIAPRQAVGRAGLDPASSADWLRLALAPAMIDRERWAGRSGEIEVAGIEPGGVDTARLAGLDAAIVSAPEQLSVEAWRRLRALADSGGVVMVVPPAGGGVHLWTDAMTRELGLAWTIGREPRVYGSADGVGVSAVRDASGGDLLELVKGELAELVRPVHVWRALPVTVGAGRAERVLALADGSPWVLAARPGEESEGTGRGLVVFFASALAMEWTDAPGKPLFVPLVQELVRQGVGRARPAWSETAGARIAAPARAVELRRDTIGESGQTRPAEGAPAPIPVDETGHAATAVRTAGVLRALDERGVTRGLVAVNADAGASDTSAQSPAAVAAWLGMLGGAGAEPVRWLDEGGAQGGAGAAGAMLAARMDDAQSSVPLLVAALIVALAELAMARWFSHAATGPQGEGATA